ncbi:MAG: hypothetical protein WKG07_20785 [Hymenobacter sp.]
MGFVQSPTTGVYLGRDPASDPRTSWLFPSLTLSCSMSLGSKCCADRKACCSDRRRWAALSAS